MYRRAALRALDYVMRRQDTHSPNPDVRGAIKARSRSGAVPCAAHLSELRDQVLRRRDDAIQPAPDAPTSLAQNRRHAASAQYVKRAGVIRLSVGIP
jgi:hypothetical protein